MPNIKLKGQTGEVLTYEDVERVYFDSADKDGEVVYYTHGQAVSKTVTPNFASGDMNVPIADGELVTELTIEKPENLEEENIRYGKTVAGVPGKFLGDTEEVTVDLDMAEGGQIITPSAPTKVLSKVVVTKPGTMLPENIRKGINIGGVDGEFLGDTEERTVELNFPSGSTEEVFLEEQVVEVSDMGGYYMAVVSSLAVFTVGETYKVEWDGTEYECVAFEADGIASIGDGTILGFPVDATGEPFFAAGSGEQVIFVTTDVSATSHTVTIYHVTEGAASDMVVTPSVDGKVLSKVTITKPEGAEQVIAKGETLGGIPGEYVTPGTTKEIKPDFSEGDQIVTAEGDERWNEVVVKVPETLMPENIVKGVEIGGVVGTFEGGGGIGNGAYNVKVIDYDGTVIAEKNLDSGEVFTLPDAPEHEGLVFDGWSSPVAITDNTVTVENQDITIGPMFHTVSGATEVDIVLTKVTGLTFTFSSVLTGMTSIDWGDGTTDSTLTHTYSDYGKYTIKVYGMTAVANGTTSNGGIVPTTSSSPNCTVVAVRFSSNVTSIGDQAFYCCHSLTNVIFPSGVTSIGVQVFSICYGLTTVIIPSSVTTVGWGAFTTCSSLTNVIIPSSVTSFVGNQAFRGCHSLTNVIFPSGVTDFNGYRLFQDCYSLKEIVVSLGTIMTGGGAFYNCTRLTNVVFLSGVTSIGSQAFYCCYSLTNVIFPSGVTSIGRQAFYNCYSLRKCDFTACNSVPALSTDVFNGCNKCCQILVPAALYDEWIAATNWSTYANYIVSV